MNIYLRICIEKLCHKFHLNPSDKIKIGILIAFSSDPEESTLLVS